MLSSVPSGGEIAGILVGPAETRPDGGGVSGIDGVWPGRAAADLG